MPDTMEPEAVLKFYFDFWALRISQDILTFKNTVFMVDFFIHIRVLQTYVVNFICQKVQHFQADSESLGKINNKKIFKKIFFQCLALPKDPQSF